MNKFRIKENGFKEIRKRYLLRTVPMLILASIGGLIIGYLQSKNLNTLYFLIPMMFVLMSVSLIITLKKQERIFNSMTVLIDDVSIRREALNTPSLRIPFNEVKEIYKHSNGNLIIKGQSYLNFIEVPAQIENFDILENMIKNNHPIVVKNEESFLKKYANYLGLLVIPIMAINMLSKNKFIIGITGIILVGGLGYSIYVIQKNKNIDNKTKNLSWISVFVLLTIFANMVMRIFKE